MRIALILAFVLLASCASVPPRAEVVETGSLVKAVDRVKSSSKVVGESIERVEESNDEAIVKLSEVEAQMNRIREMSRGDLQIESAVDSVETLNNQLSDLLFKTKRELKQTSIAKADADIEVGVLQGVVTKLVIEADRANEVQSRLERENLEVPITKGKLSWWRWYGLWVSLSVILLVAWVLRKFLAAILRMVLLASGVPLYKIPFQSND